MKNEVLPFVDTTPALDHGELQEGLLRLRLDDVRRHAHAARAHEHVERRSNVVLFTKTGSADFS